PPGHTDPATATPARHALEADRSGGGLPGLVGHVYRRGDGTLSGDRDATEGSSRAERRQCAGAAGRDRCRHEPLPNAQATALLGTTLSTSGSKRREGPLHTHTQVRQLDQDFDDPGGLVRGQDEEQLLSSAVSQATPPTRKQEGYWGCGCVHADHRVLHDPRSHPLPGSRRSLLRPTRSLACRTPF